MATIVTRSGKGAPLTNAEVDANFTNLNSDKVETSVISTFGATLTGAANAGAARTVLELGTIATQDASSVSVAALTASGAVSFTSTGAVGLPVGTEAQRPTPAAGMLRFNSDEDQFEGYDGSEWGAIGGAGGAVSDVFYENAQLVEENHEIVSGRNAMTAGPVVVDDGVTVTVASGSRWVVV